MKKILAAVTTVTLLLTGCQSDASELSEEKSPAELLYDFRGSISREVTLQNDIYYFVGMPEWESGYVDVNTLMQSQEQYESCAESETVKKGCEAYDVDYSEEEWIKNICKAHLAAARAYVRNPENYSKATFLSPEAENDEATQIHLKAYDYRREMIYTEDNPIFEDYIRFTDFSVAINGDTSTVSICEQYFPTTAFDWIQYISSTGSGDKIYDSEINTVYQFQLKKTDNTWLITSVSGDSPLEEALKKTENSLP